MSFENWLEYFIPHDLCKWMSFVRLYMLKRNMQKALAIRCLFDIIEWCQSLVVREESSGVVRFIHPTVKEFLKSRKLSVINLARTCLTYLEFNAFDDICLGEISMITRVRKYRLLCLATNQKPCPLYSRRFFDFLLPKIREIRFFKWNTTRGAGLHSLRARLYFTLLQKMD